MARAGAVWVDVLPNMSQFGRQLDRELSEPVVEASRDAGEAGGEAMTGGMRDKLKAGALAVGLLAGATLMQGFEHALAKGKVTAQLGAQLDLTGAEAAKAGKVAGQLYAQAVTESVEDGAAAVRAVMGADLVDASATTKEIGQIATAAQDLATLFEQDVAMGASAASSMIRNGLVKDAREAFDVLTAGFQKLGPKGEDLAETFNEYGPFFKKLGLDATQTLGLMSQGLEAGAWNTDKIADATKEFFLRATSGDTAVADAFKSIGVNASATEAAIAKGGPAARKAFGQVLQALRDVDDAATREQAVQALFGGPGEDLGASLFALRVETATKGLGNLQGAAKRAGDTLRDNAATDVEQFRRALMDKLTTAAADHGIPALKSLGAALNADVVPAVRSALGVLADLWGWLNEDPARLQVTVGVLSALAAGLLALRVATAVAGGVKAVWGGLQATGAAAKVAAGHVRFAAFAVRYYTVVGAQSVAQAVRTGAAWAASATRAGAGWVAARARAVGSFAATAASATANAARTAGAWVAAQARSAAATARATATMAIQRGAMVATTVATRAMAAGQWLLNAAMSANPLGLIVIGLVALGAALVLAYKKSETFRNIVNAAFQAIGTIIRWWYENIVKRYFAMVRFAFRAVGAAATWLYREAVQPAMRGISTAVSWLNDKVIQPAMTKGKNAVRALGLSFKIAKDYIGEQWKKLEGIARKPIAFIVNTVYSKGIVPTWNKVATAFGAPPLKAMKFAGGGILPGYTPGRDPHRFYSPTGGQLEMSGGESIMRPEFTRGVGSSFVYGMNRLARSRGARGVREALAPVLGGNPPSPQPRATSAFADGGIFGWIGQKVAGAGTAVWEKVKAGADWLKDGLAASARAGVNAVVKPLLRNFPGADTGFGQMIQRIPDRMIDALFGYAKKAEDKGAGSGVSGKGMQAALRWARSQAGKAYQWGGNGNPSWDCSGFLSAIESVIRGQKPHRRWSTFAFQGSQAPPGWKLGARSQFRIGITNAGVGHTAGTLGTTNVESRGGDGVVVGPRARGWNHGMFTHRYGFTGYASGGMARPGETAWVGERGPELMQVTRSGTRIWSTADSLRMAARMGPLPGYAKGTTSAAARARKDLPGDLTAFTASLTKSAADIAKAAGELAKDLRATGRSGRSLAASVERTSARLQTMARERDRLSALIETARTARTDQQGKAREFLALSNLAESATSVHDVITGMQARQATLKGFQSQIATAARKGLSQDLIRQLVEMGPESSLARLVAGAAPGQIKQLNALAASGAKLSSGYGTQMADLMYDSGRMAGRGFLTGLLAQEKAIQAAMTKLGAGAIKAIRSRKGLDARSPSRKAAAAGEDVGAGVVEGMVATLPRVASAAERLGVAAVPARAIVPVTASRGGAAAAAGGLQPGDTVILRVGEEDITAVLDRRVNAGLGGVRQRARAGARRTGR